MTLGIESFALEKFDKGSTVIAGLVWAWVVGESVSVPGLRVGCIRGKFIWGQLKNATSR